MSDKTDTPQDPKAQDWPNTVRSRDELDSALEEGLESGRSKRTVHDIFEEQIAKFKNG
jgi:hypothetical protein